MTPLDIIIVNFNTRDDLSVCLQSLHTTPPVRAHHIVVVDNASTDGSTDLVRRDFPAVQIIDTGRNAGFGAANNVGIRATSSPLVLFLNSDTIVPAGAIDRLCDRLESSPGVVAAGPRLLDRNGAPEMSWGPMLTPLVEWRQKKLVQAAERGDVSAMTEVKTRTSTERVVDWVSGACLLVTRRAALEAGLFDERYFMYEEDVDFCAALRANGGRILFTPASELTHLRGRSVAKTPSSRSSPHYDESHIKFYDKHARAWVPLLKLWKMLR